MIMWWLTLLACTNNGPVDTAPQATSTGTETTVPRVVPPPTVIDAWPGRLVAIGDVHGDYKATKKVLKLAGVLDNNQNWIGGDTVLVQTGDQLDRGDGEEKILELFESLGEQAHAAGGAFYSLLGNHEVMNVELDLRYVTDEGFADFADTPYDPSDSEVVDYPEEERGRVAAFRPGGEWATILADHNVVMQIDDVVFVHGGILPNHADHGLNKINNETRRWMRGTTPLYPQIMDGDQAPIWTRAYSDDDVEPDCDALTLALDSLGANQMVVGHTVWDTINPACDGRVWRIDVGMSEYYGGTPQVLLFEGKEGQILTD